jgi:amino acid transporter
MVTAMTARVEAEVDCPREGNGESAMAVDDHTSGKLTVRQAAFIGVGAMVGAGIFSLLGAAGEVAGAAVWLSFLIAGAIALLQGYCSTSSVRRRWPGPRRSSSTSCSPS